MTLLMACDSWPFPALPSPPPLYSPSPLPTQSNSSSSSYSFSLQKIIPAHLVYWCLVLDWAA